MFTALFETSPKSHTSLFSKVISGQANSRGGYAAYYIFRTERRTF